VQVKSGATYKFATVTIAPDNFTFETAAVRGVSYSFTGRFLIRSIFADQSIGKNASVLQGQLSNFSRGQKIAEARVRFKYFQGE